ncbi:DNA polymerase Y family protein [Streptomyces sp. NRRL S-1521]|uniref:DNA polymerase Y family protein n=1 Tax=Streptomyces sp. NRRL S-1521 TaxID=1609100 RepID=UPI000747EA88|nr:hypothetical protein [Streptomyces sp. NRRL S-1521]KUL62808.1 hypothetical protein ADL30_04495 [Streptomyces sp. NRRL S-1521]
MAEINGDRATIWHVRSEADSPEQYQQLLKLLARFTPAVQPLPPTAALAQVAGALRVHGCTAAELAARFRVQALAWYALDTRVGIGINPTVAAMASTRAGGSGVLHVPAANTAAWLAPLPVYALHGITRKHAGALDDYGITTIGRLAAVPEGTVQRIVGGKAGRLLHQRARGIDPRPILAGRMPQSTSAQHTFERDVIDHDLMRAVISRLTTTLGTRLRSRGQAATSVTLLLRFAGGSDLSKTRRLPEPSAHTEDLRDACHRILRQHGLQRGRVRRITVIAEDLLPDAPTQISLDPAREARLRAEPVMDRLAERFTGLRIGPASAFQRVS